MSERKLVWAYAAYDSYCGRIGLLEYEDEEGNKTRDWEFLHSSIPAKFDPDSDEYEFG